MLYRTPVAPSLQQQRPDVAPGRSSQVLVLQRPWGMWLAVWSRTLIPNTMLQSQNQSKPVVPDAERSRRLMDRKVLLHDMPLPSIIAVGVEEIECFYFAL